MVAARLILPLALLAAAAAASPPAGISERLARGEKIVLPPPIDQETRPYRACLLDRFENSPGLRRSDSATRQRLVADALAACADLRRQAAVAADARLRQVRRYRNAGKRQAGIEQALLAVDRGLLPLYLMMPPAPPAPANLSVEQAAIVYDQCLARAAVAASKTDASDSEIYPRARAACAETRAMLAGNPNAVPVLDSIDSERSASFPERTRKLREMRRAYQPESGKN